MTNKAMDARADRAMQSIAAMGGQDAGAILGWLRNQAKQKIILHEDVITGRKSTVGETVRSWLAIRKTLPVQNQGIESFSSIGEMRKILPAENGSVLKSERQQLLVDRRKARLESKRIQFNSGAVVEIPLTAFAASIYGRGSKWCTGAISSNAFDSYARRSPLFILRTPDNEMFQITADCDPNEFERILLNNGGMFMRDALEQFIFMSMTIKNAQDSDLSEDEFNRFMPMANDLFSMIGKSFFAEIKPTWDRYADVVRQEQGDDADEEELDMSESDVLDLMASAINIDTPATVEGNGFSFVLPYEGFSLAKKEEPGKHRVIDRKAYDKIVDALVGGEYEAAKDAIFEYNNVRRFSATSQEVESTLAARIPDEAVDRFFQWMLDHDLEAEVSDSPKPRFFLGTLTISLHMLGADRIGRFVLKQMQSGDDKTTDFLRSAFCKFPIDDGGAIYQALIATDRAEAVKYATLWASSDPTEKDVKLLPASITEQPWFKADDASSIKMGILCHGVAASESQFGLDEIIDLGREHHGILSDIDMKANPEAFIQLLYGGELTKKDFLMDAAWLEMQHDADFYIGYENDLNETLAQALCKIIDRVPMMSGEDRMVAGLCLSAVTKDGIAILERHDQWFAQAVYGRTNISDISAVTYRPLRAFDAINDKATRRVLDFLAANGVSEQDRNTLASAALISTSIPYPDVKDLEEIESMATSGSFPRESVRRLCDHGDAQLQGTCDRVRAALVTMDEYSSRPKSAIGMLDVSESYLKHVASSRDPAPHPDKPSPAPDSEKQVNAMTFR